VVNELLPAASEQYQQGFRHAVQQRNAVERDHHAATSGGVASDDLPLPLKIILGVILASAVAVAVVAKWAVGRPRRLIATILPILLFTAASALPYKNGPGEIAAMLGLLTACAAVGMALGERKDRPWSGFLLGFCFMFVGWLVTAVLPHKNESLRRQAAATVSGWNVPSIRSFMCAGLAFAPAIAIVVFFLVLFVGVSIPRAERPEILGLLIQLAFVGGLLTTIVGIGVFIGDAWHNEKLPPSKRGLWTVLLLIWEPYVAPVYFWRFMR
jgi:hypothetical protein